MPRAKSRKYRPDGEEGPTPVRTSPSPQVRTPAQVEIGPDQWAISRATTGVWVFRPQQEDDPSTFSDAPVINMEDDQKARKFASVLDDEPDYESHAADMYHDPDTGEYLNRSNFQVDTLLELMDEEASDGDPAEEIEGQDFELEVYNEDEVAEDLREPARSGALHVDPEPPYLFEEYRVLSPLHGGDLEEEEDELPDSFAHHRYADEEEPAPQGVTPGTTPIDDPFMPPLSSSAHKHTASSQDAPRGSAQEASDAGDRPSYSGFHLARQSPDMFPAEDSRFNVAEDTLGFSMSPKNGGLRPDRPGPLEDSGSFRMNGAETAGEVEMESSVEDFSPKPGTDEQPNLVMMGRGGGVVGVVNVGSKGRVSPTGEGRAEGEGLRTLKSDPPRPPLHPQGGLAMQFGGLSLHRTKAASDRTKAAGRRESAPALEGLEGYVEGMDDDVDGHADVMERVRGSHRGHSLDNPGPGPGSQVPRSAKHVTLNLVPQEESRPSPRAHQEDYEFDEEHEVSLEESGLSSSAMEGAAAGLQGLPPAGLRPWTPKSGIVPTSEGGGAGAMAGMAGMFAPPLDAMHTGQGAASNGRPLVGGVPDMDTMTPAMTALGRFGRPKMQS